MSSVPGFFSFLSLLVLVNKYENKMRIKNQAACGSLINRKRGDFRIDNYRFFSSRAHSFMHSHNIIRYKNGADDDDDDVWWELAE